AGPEAVVRLVHANLALGFGAEARAVLASFPGVVASAPALSAVARLIDGEAVGPGGALAGLDRCAEAGALWAFLATPGTVPPDPAAVDAVVRAVSALPPHLRDHLGPVVAQRLAQAGLRDAALAVRDAMARGPGTDAGGIVNAALAPPADPAAEAGLLAIVAADGPGAAAALATFVEGRIAAGLPVQPETAQDAAIFAREARGGPGADRLARAAVLARAASGDLAGAVAALAGLAGDPVADAETRAAVFDLVTRRADDPTFLVIALEGLVGANPVRPTGAAAVAMAERLLALGFGDEAEAMLASAGAMAGRAAEGASPADGGADAAMLLRARAGLAAGDPAAALRRLAGGDGPAAEALRAEALEALGDLRGATAAWQRAGLPEAAARTAWAAADWRSVVEVAAATAAAADVPDPRAPLVARLAALASDAAAEPAASP
ncbi:MAG: hypothetical protein H5U20_08930, partial [Rhodobacteraceae bacterium]|nr:hypothetical protein [Paracoccaceae bacterium]